VVEEEYTCADTAAHSGGTLSLALAAAPTTATQGTAPREHPIQHRRHRPRRQCSACAVRFAGTYTHGFGHFPHRFGGNRRAGLNADTERVPQSVKIT
jgi:hypothetical protein